MKQLFIIPAVISLFFFSCSKKADSPTGGVNTISASINGATENFNTIVVAKNTTMSGAYSLYFSGVTGTTSSSDELSITIDDLQAIKPGTYTIDLTGTSEPAIGYDKQYTTGNLTNFFLSDITGANPTIVTITSLTATNVQGTFNGTLVLESGGAGTVAVTNGKFNVNFK